MKIKFCILFILICNIALCQIKTGEITYKFILDDFDKGDVFKRASKGEEDRLRFVLKFADSLSVYETVENIELGSSSSLAAAFSGYSNPVYFNSNENIYCYNNSFTPFTDDGEFLICTKDTINWNLTNESKMINNYLCYKATKQKLSTKKEKEYFTVVAWYCPKIAIPFGPLEYFGLPGLIFELHNLHGAIVIDKIKLNTKTIIKQTKKASKISKEEYKKILDYRRKENEN